MTVTLDDDVEQLLKDESIRSGKSLNVVLNDTVRRVLGRKSESGPALRDSVAMGLRAEIGLRGLNKVADDMEADTFLESARKLSRARK